MTVDECIEFLNYRIDRIQQPILNLNIPIFNGVANIDGELIARHTRLCEVYLCDKDLRKADRVWQVGIFDDTNSRGVSVFEGNTLCETLNKAVEYVKGQKDY